MIVKNEQNIFVPEYLNARFFCTALEEGLRDRKITINEINFEWGSNPGENYCSSIYRVSVSFTRFGSQQAKPEQIYLIIKTIPESQFLEDAGVFLKEVITYSDVIPRLEILANDEQFGAKCYYTQREPMNTVVMKDLKEEGFTVASRQEGLDWNHSNLMLRKLAKFHATSMVLIKKDPEIINHFSGGMLAPFTVKGRPEFSKIFATSLEQLIELTSNWDGFEEINAKLMCYLESFKEITSTFGLPQPGDRYKVLNHGDMWTNNFMFAYDDPSTPKVPTRAIFVDFQLTFYGSPGCDINFFLNTSVQLDVLRKKRDDLISGYYASFVNTLEYLRYNEIPTFDDLKAELRQRELYGLFALYGFLPLVTMSKELSADNTIETMVDDSAKRKKFAEVFASEKLQTHLKYSLKRLEDLGVFDEI